MDFKAIIDSVKAVAGATLTAVVPGGAAIAAAGQKVVELIDHVTEEFSGQPELTADLETLQEDRDALEEAVNKHVDKTVKALRGD